MQRSNNLHSFMKTTSILRSAFVAATLLLPALALGQGPLNPPSSVYLYPNERALTPAGNPTPNMKTLMQIDSGEHIPSRDTNNANLNGSLGYYLLAAPGRYYLTENVSLRLLITSDNVTLDLGGFEVRYTGAGTGPIAIEAQSGVLGNVIRTKVINGRVRGNWAQGIILSDDSVVSGVDISDTGTFGIKVGKNSQVADCRVHGTWQFGQPGGPSSAIWGNDATIVSQCTVTGIAGIGIQVNLSGRVVDSTVNFVAGCGIVTNHHCSVAGCAVRTCGSTGFDLGMGSSLHNSAASECNDSGVHVRNGCTLNNVSSRDNAGHGFLSESWTVMNQQYNKNATSYVHCVAQGNDKNGFHATSNCLFDNCTADDSGMVGNVVFGHGFYVSDHCRITNSIAANNQLSGICGASGNTIDQCSATGNGMNGIQVANDQNIVTRNTLRSNTLAPIQPAPGTGGLAPLVSPSMITPNPFGNFGL